MKKSLLALAIALVPSLAWAQGAVLQNGPIIKFDLPGWVQDKTIMSGGKIFTDNFRGFNTSHFFDNHGPGVCTEDALTSGAYHQVCIGHDATGNATITVDALNGAAVAGLNFRIGGTSYTFPGAGNGDMAGPSASVDSAVVAFSGTGGKTTKDTGVILYGVPAAVGDGITDDRAAIAARLATLPSTGGTLRLNSSMKYRLVSSLTIPANVTIDCGMWPGTTASGNPGGNIAALAGLRLGASTTITLSPGSGIHNCAVLQYGLPFQYTTNGEVAAAYTGTAINLCGGNCADTHLRNLLIAGFNQCIDFSNGGDRYKLYDVECDGLNGYKFGPNGDTSLLSHVRAWPWGTYGVVWPAALRSGTGFSFTGRQDHVVLTGGILDFGHVTGIDLEQGGGNCCAMNFEETVWLDTNTTALKVGVGVDNGLGSDIFFNSLQVVGGITSPARILLNAGQVHIQRLMEYVDNQSQDCVQNNNAILNIAYAHIYGCLNFAVHTTGTGVTTVGAGRVQQISSSPYFNIPTAGAVFLSPAVLADFPAFLLPNNVGLKVINSATDTKVGIGTATPSRALTVNGPGATASVIDSNGGGSEMAFTPPAATTASVGQIDVTGTNDFRVNSNTTELFRALANGGFRLGQAHVLASTDACSLSMDGSLARITDSNTKVPGAVIGGGGTNKVIGYCNGGGSWTVGMAPP